MFSFLSNGLSANVYFMLLIVGSFLFRFHFHFVCSCSVDGTETDVLSDGLHEIPIYHCRYGLSTYLSSVDTKTHRLLVL